MKKFYCFIFLICTAFGAVDRYQHQQDLERANLEMLIFEGLPQTQVIPNVFGILASLMSFSLTRFVDNDLIPTEARIRDEFHSIIADINQDMGYFMMLYRV